MTRRSLPHLLLLTTILAATVLALVGSTACRPARKNLVLITVPGLRADRVGLQTPTLALIEADGTRLDLATLSPDTIPALASLFSGEAPGSAYGGFGDSLRLAAGESETLAERLKKEGFHTAAINGQGNLDEITGLFRGFDSAYAPSTPFDQRVLPDEEFRVLPSRRGFYSASTIADHAGARLRDQAGDGPLFLWVHLADIQPAILSDNPGSSYSVALREIDSAIAFLRDSLHTYGLASSTVLVVASLHGEGLSEMGEVGHGLSLSESVMRVPVFVEAADHQDGDPTTLPELRSHILALLDIVDPIDNSFEAQVQVTELPKRLYGWPALSRQVGSERDPNTTSEVPDPELLTLVRRAYEKARAGKYAEAAELNLQAARRAPRALAPRAVALANLMQDAKQRRTRDKRIDGLVEELKIWEPGCPEEALDLARALSLAQESKAALEFAETLAASELTPGQRLSLARMFVDLDALEAALELIEAQTAIDRDAPELDEWAGDLHLRRGNAYRARLAFEKAAETPRARTPNLLAKLGDACADLDDRESALQAYAGALSLDARYRYPHLRAGELFLAMGDTVGAADAFVKSLREQDDATLATLSRMRLLAERGLVDAARTELSEALALQPDDDDLHTGLVRLEVLSGQPGIARRVIEDWIQSAPGNPLPHLERARMEAHLGQEDAAIEALNAAEPKADSAFEAIVRAEPLFQKGGAQNPLARRAASFTGTLGQEKHSR